MNRILLSPDLLRLDYSHFTSPQVEPVIRVNMLPVIQLFSCQADDKLWSSVPHLQLDDLFCLSRSKWFSFVPLSDELISGERRRIASSAATDYNSFFTSWSFRWNHHFPPEKKITKKEKRRKTLLAVLHLCSGSLGLIG